MKLLSLLSPGPFLRDSMGNRKWSTKQVTKSTILNKWKKIIWWEMYLCFFLMNWWIVCFQINKLHNEANVISTGYCASKRKCSVHKIQLLFPWNNRIVNSWVLYATLNIYGEFKNAKQKYSVDLPNKQTYITVNPFYM